MAEMMRELLCSSTLIAPLGLPSLSLVSMSLRLSMIFLGSPYSIGMTTGGSGSSIHFVFISRVLRFRSRSWSSRDMTRMMPPSQGFGS